MAKVDQIGPKWDKFGIFSDQIPVDFGSLSSLSQNVLQSNLAPVLCLDSVTEYFVHLPVIIDKDFKPQWQPHTLDLVSEERVDFYFSPLEDGLELQLEDVDSIS